VTPPSSPPHPDDQTIEQLLGVGSGTWHGPEHVDYRRLVDVLIQQLEPASAARRFVQHCDGTVRQGGHCHNGIPSINQGAIAMKTPYEIRPIGHVVSPLVDSESAPKQGSEGAPDAWLVFDPDVAEGIRDLAVGTDIFVLTWLHQARRDVLAVHPRDDPRNPEKGVFSTRSEDRPNPIGLHRVHIAAIDGPRVLVRNLEAFDETPIVDVKPVLADGR
jgi:tRNA-Thr(GGU) m(6)t(6)A37 methyltransferase TsaA